MFKFLQKLFGITTLLLLTLGNTCQEKILTENEKVIVIPMDLSSQRPVIKVMINNKGPYRFIFDTGSSGSDIDSELARELGLEVIRKDTLYTPGSDDMLMSEKIRVSKVSFLGTDIAVRAVMNTIPIRQMLPVDGIISPEFFSDYLITLDYPNSKLLLAKGELTKADKDVISFNQNDMVINFDIFVNDRKVEAHMDSGNPSGFNIPYSQKDKLSFKKEPILAGMIRTPVTSFKRWSATLNGTIKVGNITYKDPVVNLVEGFKFVNLGYQVFKDLKITIDKKNNLIKFE